MKHYELSTKCTLWANRFIMLAMTVLCFTMYNLLVWYGGVRNLPWQICSAILIGFYLCVPGTMYALWCIEKLLRNILKEDVFVTANVRYVRRIRYCCAAISLICIPVTFFYLPMIFMAVIMAFLALAVSVVKNLLAAAVVLREENDLTV